jgi:hypothetical protein
MKLSRRLQRGLSLLTAALLVSCPNPANHQSSAKAITEFNFASPAVNGVITESTHTISITVPYGTNITAMVPTIVTTGSSISPASGVAKDFTNPVIYTVTAADSSTQNYSATVTVSPNSAKAITAFGFTSPAVNGIIAESTHSISITVPYGTNITALVPTIAITGSSISPASGVAKDFTNPATYTVTAADSSTQNYSVTVTVSSNYAKAITAFGFTSPAVNGVIAESTHSISITVPYGTIITALVPTIDITGSSISPASGVAKDFTNPVTYTVTAADSSTQNYSVTVTASPNSAKAITAFGFTSPAVNGVIAESTHTVAIAVPSGTAVENLVAIFSITGESLKTGLTLQTSGTSSNNYSNPVIFIVVAADGSTQDYVVTVTLKIARLDDDAVWDTATFSQ